MEPIEVDCVFVADGTVRVRRIAVDGTWEPVEQGRQWLDDAGRHVLVMLHGREVREIVLDPATLTWQMQEGPGREGYVV